MAGLMKKVDLSKFRNPFYKPGNLIRRVLWYIAKILLFENALPWPYPFKSLILRIFGAKVGRGVVIKPSVRIKYPWFLSVGDNVWIGEKVWIDNLGHVSIGNNVCLSQGVFIITGNHNYKKESFDLIIRPVLIEEGVWAGARSLICPGVRLKSHSVITAGSVATKDTEPYMIYQGNPACIVDDRSVE